MVVLWGFKGKLVVLPEKRIQLSNGGLLFGRLLGCQFPFFGFSCCDTKGSFNPIVGLLNKNPEGFPFLDWKGDLFTLSGGGGGKI